MRASSLGVYQITPRNSTEISDYGVNDTSSRAEGRDGGRQRHVRSRLVVVVQLVPMRGPADRHRGRRYRLVEPIGEGGTSVVYRAEHVRLGRAAALKLLTPALGEADFRERFLRESRLAASLDHPSIVPVYDAGEADDVLYIAMQHIDGQRPEGAARRRGPAAVRRALRIVAQVASALDAAHARGLVHRDVKPANILVGDGRPRLPLRLRRRQGAVVVRARRAPAASSARSTTARPSRSRAATSTRAPTSTRSRACSTSASPARRRSAASSDVATLNAHLHAPPPRFSKAAPDLPPALEPVLAKALAKSPLDRYATCGELVAALRAAVAEPRVHSRRLVVSLALLAARRARGRRRSRPRSSLGLRHEPAPRVTTVVERQRAAQTPAHSTRSS